MEQWKQRLIDARTAKGLNKTEFAKAVRVSNPTVTDWEKSVADGGIKEISGVRLARVCEVLGVDPMWLLNGKGVAPSKPVADDAIEDIKPVRATSDEDPEWMHIPMVRLVVSAGVSGFGIEPAPHDGTTAAVRSQWIRKRNLRPERLLAIRVRGRSMEPDFHEGDTVIINQDDTERVDGQVYVFNYEGEDVLKRLVRDAGDWWLVSDNPDQKMYHRKLCRGADCLIIGRVIRSEREYY